MGDGVTNHFFVNAANVFSQIQRSINAVIVFFVKIKKVLSLFLTCPFTSMVVFIVFNDNRVHSLVVLIVPTTCRHNFDINSIYSWNCVSSTRRRTR